MLEGLLDILQGLLGWLLLLIFQLLLKIVEIVESFFNIFAGTQKVYYDREPVYLFDLFFSNNAVTKMFWGMAIIAVVMSFGFCIVAVARKVTDISGTTKHTLGQIMSNFIRSIVVILLLNLCIVAAINMTTVIFERINYTMEHSATLGGGGETQYTDEEFATMVRILATMGNYAANPSAESRYNVNACFNAIRGEMTTLYKAGCFNYDFPLVQEGKHTWQSALAQVAKAANLSEDLQLDTYYPSVQEAIILCFDQLKTNPNFKPQESAVRKYTAAGGMNTAQMIFFAASMGAEENEQFRNGTIDDALRRSYLNGEKSIYYYDDVFWDFSLTKINYVMGVIAAICCILFLGKVALLFIVRIFNLLMLYIVSPLFASSMVLDDGNRFQNWTQSFVMQLFSAYGGIVMMRVYMLIIPIIYNENFSFFDPLQTRSMFNMYGQLAIVLAGAWAVSRGSEVLSGALSGNAAAAVNDADSTFGRNISDFMGASRLYSEIGRLRQNRDRKKSQVDANKETNKSNDSDKSQSSATESRNRSATPKDDGQSSSSTDSLNRLRNEYGLDGGANMDPKSKEFESNELSSVSQLRTNMGFDSPAGENDKFDVDSLPSVSKSRTSKTDGTKSTSKTGGTKSTSKTSTTSTSGLPGRTRSNSTADIKTRENLKSKIKNRS